MMLFEKGIFFIINDNCYPEFTFPLNKWSRTFPESQK